MKRVTSGGGWPAIFYTFRMARKAGWWKLWKAMSSKNACKTCALGMGGQGGGMRNEAGHWPEVCKKSLQAMVADMQAGLRSEFFERYGFNELRTLSPRELESAGRITQPLWAGKDDSHYREISWDEATQRLAARLKETDPNRAFFYFSGRSSNEAGFLLQLFARLYGTNNVNNCSYYCHQASGAGLTDSLGTGTATLTLEDVEKTELFFLIGGNPASNHPRLMRSLMQVRRRGGKVIVINPVVETGLVNFRVPSDVRSLLFGSPIASQYVQPHIGSDIPLLCGIAKGLLARNAVDTDYIRQFTEGYDAFAQFVEQTSWSTIEQACGVDRTTIETMAETYAAAKSAVFGWTMGITHHEHGVANVQMIVNLALMRGMVGRPNAGMLPIRGHSNVQGIGSMGVTPQLKQTFFNRLQTNFGVQLPTTPGMDTLACMHAADRGEVDVAVALGGNLFGSNPDANFATHAISKIGLMVYLNTTLNTGHAWGRGQDTLVLPVLARDEEPQTTTQESMFNYVRISDGGAARHSGPRSEVTIIADIARQTLGEGGPVDWQSMLEHSTIRKMIGDVVPGYERIGEIDQTHKEFVVGGRTFHAPQFATPSTKAQFRVHPLPTLRRKSDELCLMTVRSEGQFNTVVYEEEDLYRGQDRRDIILLNRADMDRLGFKQDERVTVRSHIGAMSHILVREYAIKEGNALMYYPEANVLVPATVDPVSRTPSFKSVLITLEKESELTPLVIGNGQQMIPLETLRREAAASGRKLEPC